MEALFFDKLLIVCESPVEEYDSSMPWESLNHIILPLFISTATPVEKQRDTIMSSSHAQVLAYCKDMPMTKSKDYSYPCRLQIEADCQDLSNNKACDLLAKLKDAERDAREKQILAREKVKDTTFWCKVRFEWEREPAQEKKERVFVQAGSMDLDGDLKWTGKFSTEVREKIQRLKDLGQQIRSMNLPVSCSRDSDCHVQGIGDKGCGGFVSSVYYSGNPSVIQDILTFNKLDDELNRIIQNASTCDYHMLYVPKCEQNICSASTTPLK